VNNEAVTSAFPGLYSKIAECYEDLGYGHAKKNPGISEFFCGRPSDKGLFITGRGRSAGWRSSDSWVWVELQSELVMNHIYFTALSNGAGLAAALAKGEGPERRYIVEPTGRFENDPNVTDKKIFPAIPHVHIARGAIENSWRSHRLGETNT